MGLYSLLKTTFQVENKKKNMVVRSYDDEMGYIERINDHSFRIKKGFQPNMNVEVDSWAPQALWKSKFVWGANPTKKLWDVWPTLWLTSMSAMHVGYRHRPSRWDVRHMSVKHPNFFQLEFSTLTEAPVRHAHCEYISLNSNIFPHSLTLPSRCHVIENTERSPQSFTQLAFNFAIP